MKIEIRSSGCGVAAAAAIESKAAIRFAARTVNAASGAGVSGVSLNKGHLLSHA
jgi:hypothetical protein